MVVAGTATPVPYGGGLDAFVSRLSADLMLADVTPDPFTFIAQSNVPAKYYAHIQRNPD